MYTPILAMFAGYVGGYGPATRMAGLRLSLPFVAGNIVPLALIGAIAALVGSSVLQVFTGYQLDRWIPGIVGFVMGLRLLGILNVQLPAMPTPRHVHRPTTEARSFFLGLPFGLVVTPCTIPIFIAIATFVTFQASIIHGILLMATYAMGRGGILVAVATSASLLKALNIGRNAQYAERASGVLILIVSLGLLVFYDEFVRFTGQWMTMAH